MVKKYFLAYSHNYFKETQNFMCVLLFFIALFLSGNLYSQIDKTSTANGTWTSVNWNPNGTPSLNDNAIINTQVTIPLGTTVEINNLRIASNGKLIVNGNLKVNGSINMDNKTPEFIMGDEAVVTVIGDFISSNKIDISISSYLIIQGDFIKTGSSGQGSLDVSNGNIYIFGEVDGFPELTSCDGTYDGTTTEETVETCDYGTEVDYVNNQESFPPEVQALINCFALTKLNDVIVCATSDVTFNIDPITEVTYQWQVKLSSGGWENINGEIGSSLTIPSTTVSLSNNKYRVVVNATANNLNNCKIGISNFATLTVIDSALSIEPINGISKVCPGTSGINYTIPLVNNATSYNWTVPSDWLIEAGQNTNSITVTSGNTSGTNTIMISVTNSCGIVASEILSVDIQGTIWTGAINTDWNTSGNWNCNIIPVISSNVLIPNGLTNYPILNGGAFGKTNSLVIETNATLQILNNTLEIYGVVSNLGSFNALSGTISYKGAAAQLIPLNIFINNRIENLIIDNVLGVTLSGILEITGYVNAANGNLNTANNLTLISDATQTALIDGSGLGSISGTVTMQRYLDTAIGYKYFSSPFNNSIVGDFSSYVDLNASFPQVYNYDESRTDGNNNDISGWKSYTSSASSLGTLEGYAFNFGTSGTAVTVEISGKVNNGNLQRSLSNTNGTFTKGFNLVGNPYPSPINWESSGWTKTNIDNGIYFFSATDQYKGTYTSYVNNISSTDGNSSNIIPSMQGFFVHVSDGGDITSDTNGILGLTNAVRINDFTQQFIKESEPDPISLIRISAGIKDNSIKDAMVIYFDPFAKEVFEKDMDALKLMNTDEKVPNIYSLTSKSEKLSINALPISLKNTNQRIPLGINSEIDGEMSIQLKDLKNLPSNYNVYLIDEVKRIGQNLSENPEYHFNIKAGEYNTRFYLIFSEYKLSDPALAFNEPFSVMTINGNVTLNLNLDNGSSGIIRATTVTGQLLDVRNVTGKESIIIDGIRSSGIYFINLSWKDQQFSKKIMIQK